MTKEEFINKVKNLETDEEKLAFEDEYLNLSDDDKERIGAAAIPFIELCGFIKLKKKRGNHG